VGLFLWVQHGLQPECREVYDAAQTRYKGRCTAPLLIDKKQQKLVSNESSDIMRMLNSVSLPGCNDIDLYPSHLQSEINEVNDLVYDKVCAALPPFPFPLSPPPPPPFLPMLHPNCASLLLLLLLLLLLQTSCNNLEVCLIMHMSCIDHTCVSYQQA
jgi:hypothetical protein